MKKYLIIASAALVALVACTKEKDYSEPAPVKEGAVLTFSSQRPQLTPDTKTAWNSTTSSIDWTSGDRIRVGYTLEGKWMAKAGEADFVSNPKVPAKFFASSNVEIDSKDAGLGRFSVPSDFTNTPTGKAIFYAVYPNSAISADAYSAPSLSVTLPANQTPGANTFDSAADIMVGQSSEIDLTGTFPSDPIELDWNRVVAHADLTFTGLKDDGNETVSKITLTFNDEAKVAGSFYVDVTNGDVTTNTGSKNEIVLSGSNLAINEHSIKAWATVLPVSFSSLNVAIKTDKATYVRPITGLSKAFKGNARNTLTINMAGAGRTENTEVIADGNYVLAVSSGESYYAINSSANGSSNRRDRYELPSAFNPTSYSTSSPFTDNSALVWTITNVSGGVQISYAGAPNQYMMVGNNTLPLGSSGATFEVTENNGKYVFRNGGRFICMNAAYGFGCYTDESYPKDFYAIPASGTPELAIDDITLPNGAEVSSPVTITPSTALFINSIVVNGVYSETACTTEVDWLSVTYSGGALSYTASANETSASRTAYVSVKGVGTIANTDNVIFSVTQPKIVSYNNKWVLVTNVNELSANDKVVIVNTGGTKALGTTQNSNNRNAVDVTIDSEDNNIVNINDNVQQLTLGKSGNNWTFYTGQGYLYAASSGSNYLRTQTDNDANGEWSITLNTSYEASIVAQGDNTRNQLKNNGEIFSCYSSGQTAVKIYKFHEDPNAPALSVSPATTAASPAAWEADNDDAKQFTVSATNGTWAITSNGVSSWANVQTSGDVITVTPKEKQASEAHDGTIVVTLTPTNSGYENQTATIYLSQAKYSAGGTPKTSTLTFTAACGGSGTADDNVKWTVTSDASESAYDDTKGIHYGTGKAAVSYLTLNTSGISGTVTSVKVNASGASSTSATISVTVGGSAYGQTHNLTSTATEYSFTGSASGEIIISISQSSAKKALYCKSVEVTYN